MISSFFASLHVIPAFLCLRHYMLYTLLFSLYVDIYILRFYSSLMNVFLLVMCACYCAII